MAPGDPSPTIHTQAQSEQASNQKNHSERLQHSPVSKYLWKRSCDTGSARVLCQVRSSHCPSSVHACHALVTKCSQ
eukprot:12884863-Prorocentrum_lima.AAC.1